MKSRPGHAPPITPSAQLRMDVVIRVLRRLAPKSVVEVGPEMGGSSWHVAQLATYLGFEPDSQSFGIAMSRLSGLDQAKVVNAPLPSVPDVQVDVLLALEVLEHIDDDDDALNQWCRWVRPGGAVLVSVPAKEARFDTCDSAVGHYRRYEKEQLAQKMQRAGLVNITIRSYGMPLGYLLEWVRNRILVRTLSDESETAARTLRSGRVFQPKARSRVVEWLIWPFRMIQRVFERTDWGIGWVALGHLPT